MGVTTRLTSDELAKVILAFSGLWKRYRSPYGVVRAAEATDEFEIVCADGVMIGQVGDFICIAETTFDCWVDDAFNFHRLHTEIVRAGE
jgi:hypothetical protein